MTIRLNRRNTIPIRAYDAPRHSTHSIVRVRRGTYQTGLWDYGPKNLKESKKTPVMERPSGRFLPSAGEGGFRGLAGSRKTSLLLFGTKELLRGCRVACSIGQPRL